MNSRLFCTSRLATAETTQLPEFKIAFQFFLPMPAALKNPMRSCFINLKKNKSLTPALSPFGRGEGEKHLPLHARVPESHRPATVRCRRPAHTRRACRSFRSDCAKSG